MESELMRLDETFRRNDRLDRWRQGFASLALATLAFLVLSGQAKREPRVVEAERFVLRSTDGEERATLAVHDDTGVVILKLRGGEQSRVVLAASPNSGSAVKIVHGSQSVLVSVGGSGAAGVLVSDSAGRPRGEFGVNEQAAVRLELRDENGATRVETQVDKLGGHLSLMGELRKRRVHLEAPDRGDVAMSMRDANGHLRMLMGSMAGGAVPLSFLDSNGKLRLTLGLGGEDSPQIVMRDESGKKLWRIPDAE